MSNFRGDPGLGGGGAVGFSGISGLAAALAAQAQNPNMAQMNGLSAAIARGAFGTPMANSRSRREGSIASPAAGPPATPFAPPARPVTPTPPSVYRPSQFDIMMRSPQLPATPQTSLPPSRPLPNVGTYPVGGLMLRPMRRPGSDWATQDMNVEPNVTMRGFMGDHMGGFSGFSRHEKNRF
jgi:hypothetical protein